MLWILYRSILAELLKTIGLTTAVLVTVITFGATIKPLASDMLLDAKQTAKYLGLAIVPMLQFALPFAAGFGATISTHRLASDNELQAMAASGISYRRIFMPILGMGLALGLIMVVLTQWVIPRFWHMIEETLATDVTKLFEVSIRRGEAFTLGDMQIYADDLLVRDYPEGPDGPETRLILVKVVAGELDESGKLVTDVTANQAVVDVYKREGRRYLKFVLSDTVAFDSETGDLARIGRVEPRAIMVPSIVRDNPKAMTQTELFHLRKHPDEYGGVIKARDELAHTIHQATVREQVDAQLNSAGQIELQADPFQNDQLSRRYVVKARGMRGDAFQTAKGDNVAVLQIENDNPIREFTSDVVELHSTSHSSLSTTSYDLFIGEHDVRDLRRDGSPNRRGHLWLSGLTLNSALENELTGQSSEELLERAESITTSPGKIKRAVAALEHELNSIQWETMGRLMNRYALSITAVLLLILGAMLAVWLRESLPLTIYLLAFIPAIADLVVIASGEQLLRDGRIIGFPLMWSGNALLLFFLFITYFKLSRN